MLADSKYVKTQLVSDLNLFYQIQHPLSWCDGDFAQRVSAKVRKSINANFHHPKLGRVEVSIVVIKRRCNLKIMSEVYAIFASDTIDFFMQYFTKNKKFTGTLCDRKRSKVLSVSNGKLGG